MIPRSLLAAALTTAATSAQAQIAPDLVWDDATIVEINTLVDQITIEFTYRIKNIGDDPINIEGADKASDLDNVAIQTYLTNSLAADGPLIAAAGSAIFNGVELFPNHSFTGTFFSNTVQLPNLLDFGENIFLVADIVNTSPDEPIDNQDNNRIVIALPEPATAGLLLAGLALIGRRHVG